MKRARNCVLSALLEIPMRDLNSEGKSRPSFVSGAASIPAPTFYFSDSKC